MPLETNDTTNAYTIGEWSVDPIRSRIEKDNVSQNIEKRLISLLTLLAESSPEAVSKQQILDTVWKNKVVSDETLSVAISGLRKALGCNARNPVYIETLTGYGFRLIQPVSISCPNESKPPNAAVKRHKRSILWLAASGIAALILISLLSLNPFIESKPNDHLAGFSEVQLSQYKKARYLIRQAKNLEQLVEAEVLLTDLLNQKPESALTRLSLSLAKHFQVRFDKTIDINEVKQGYLSALEIDPKLTTAHFQLAKLSYQYDRDFNNVIKHTTLCINLAPTDKKCHLYRSEAYHLLGHYEQALKGYKAVTTLDPNHYTDTSIIWLYTMAERYDLAEHELIKLVSVASDDPRVNRAALLLYENTGRSEQAFVQYLALFAEAGYSSEDLSAAHAAYSTGGLRALNAWLANEKQEQQNVGQGTPPISTARYLIEAGEYERALDLLEQAYKAGSNHLLWINVDPKYRPLRSHPRFQKLLKDYGLIDSSP